jgi:DNA replication and repair protein RecF
VGKRLIDFTGQFKITLFGPHHLDLVTESPSTRRDFLDEVLSQVDREYRRASRSYSKGIRQRNKLLYRIREEGASSGQLIFWDKMLIKNGTYISRKRDNLIEFINKTKPLKGHEFSLEYDRSAISESRLDQYKEEEIAAATTLVGPHRDDFIFFEKREGEKREMAKYASRGEQRMSVLWLKLAELKFLEESNLDSSNDEVDKPTLLLDDIFSELDDNHREVVFEAVKGRQTIMTTADPHYLKNIKNLETIKLKR